MSRGLTIVVAEPKALRFRAALTMALAQRALGGEARLFLEAEAVVLMGEVRNETDHRAAGLPTSVELLAEALGGGVRLILCQSGLALAGLQAADLDPRIAYGGMVGLLAELGEDRLVVA